MHFFIRSNVSVTFTAHIISTILFYLSSLFLVSKCKYQFAFWIVILTNCIFYRKEIPFIRFNLWKYQFIFAPVICTVSSIPYFFISSQIFPCGIIAFSCILYCFIRLCRSFCFYSCFTGNRAYRGEPAKISANNKMAVVFITFFTDFFINTSPLFIVCMF